MNFFFQLLDCSTLELPVFFLNSVPLFTVGYVRSLCPSSKKVLKHNSYFELSANFKICIISGSISVDFSPLVVG